VEGSRHDTNDILKGVAATRVLQQIRAAVATKM